MEAESDGGGRNSEVVLKEWSQQIVVLLSMNVIYKITGLAVWHTTQGTRTASAARHGVVGMLTAW